jgi:hypothetical protein
VVGTTNVHRQKLEIIHDGIKVEEYDYRYTKGSLAQQVVLAFCYAR